MEFHVAPLKTKLEPGPTGCAGGVGPVVVLQHHGHLTQEQPFPCAGQQPCSARRISSQSKTCQGGLWGSVSPASHSPQHGALLILEGGGKGPSCRGPQAPLRPLFPAAAPRQLSEQPWRVRGLAGPVNVSIDVTGAFPAFLLPLQETGVRSRDSPAVASPGPLLSPDPRPPWGSPRGCGRGLWLWLWH